jgi:AraC-like DNA-binding protein
LPDARARHVAEIAGTHAHTVRDVATELGLGERGLRSWSAGHLGIGLRRFIRIRRLHAALERRLACPTETWSRIAATTGFADQPHLVRDCRALLGESPGQFFTRAG